MKCPRCEEDNPPQAKFCFECAAPLALRCPNCGTHLLAGAKFCIECATPVGAEGSPPRFASPAAYTPKHLAEKILTSKESLEGERKHVTVLFADLKGSMELLADRDPEEARQLLDPVIEHMMEAVHRYEGTVNQVMGDGIMALFGAPLAHEDHAVRACYSALRMQESVKSYAEAVFRRHGVPVEIRVGLNSGEVVVRAIGSDLHMDYTAIGQTTHLAARMEQLADPGSILLTRETFALAEGFVQVTSLGRMAVKGLSVPVEVYKLGGISGVRSRLQAATARGLSPFVGRHAELAQLSHVLDQARQGRGQVAAIAGEPGVGKSRLVFELIHSNLVEGWLVLEGDASSHGKATSYLPVSALLRSYFRLGERDTYANMSLAVRARLSALGESDWPAAHALEALLGVPVENERWQGLEPRQRRQHTLEALRRLILRESQIQPLLLVLEDLHWIDAETQAWLNVLVEGLPAARVMLLVTYRPEYQHAWGNRTHYTQLRVDPLPREGAEELLQALVGTGADLASLRKLLIQRTDGNPFFLEESVRTLVGTKSLVGERGAHRLAQPLDNVQLPATVQSMLASRIDRLLPAEKRLLQLAAVIGKDVAFGLLHVIADDAEESVRRQLALLQSAQFLDETRPWPESEYTFKHALTHEVAYRSLLQSRRRTVHQRIVEAIEAAFPERLSEHVERLAHHALNGEVWGKALHYMRWAAQKAASRSAHREAASCLDEALAVMSHLPDSREVQVTGIDVRLELRNSLLALGEVEREGMVLTEARERAEAVDDPSRLSLSLIYESSHFGMLGAPQSALASAERARSISERLGDSSLQIQADYELAKAWSGLGEYRRAADELQALVEAVEGMGVRRGGPGMARVHTRTWLATNLVALGELDKALATAEEAVQIAESAAYDFSLIHACIVVGMVHATRGSLEKAILSLERSLMISEASGLKLMLRLIASTLGSAYTLSGRPKDSVSLLEEVRASTAGRLLGGEALLLTELGTAYLPLAKFGVARKAASDALTLARLRSERGVEAWVLRLWGDLHLAADPPEIERAKAAYNNAMDRAQELGMRPLVAHCHLGFGRLYRRVEKHEQAQEHLATATMMYRDMGMTYWLERAERELKS